MEEALSLASVGEELEGSYGVAVAESDPFQDPIDELVREEDLALTQGLDHGLSGRGRVHDVEDGGGGGLLPGVAPGAPQKWVWQRSSAEEPVKAFACRDGDGWFYPGTKVGEAPQMHCPSPLPESVSPGRTPDWGSFRRTNIYT